MRIGDSDVRWPWFLGLLFVLAAFWAGIIYVAMPFVRCCMPGW